MKCAYSQVHCKVCDKNPDCLIYTDRYVLRSELKKLEKSLEDALTVIKAILHN